LNTIILPGIIRIASTAENRDAAHQIDHFDGLNTIILPGIVRITSPADDGEVARRVDHFDRQNMTFTI
jgi:hypothetical protein